MTPQEFYQLQVGQRIALRTRGQTKTGRIIRKDSAVYVRWDGSTDNGMLYPTVARDVERID